MGAFWNEQKDREYAKGHGVSLEKAAQERQHRELMRSLNNLHTQASGSSDAGLKLTNDQRREMVERYYAMKQAQANAGPDVVGKVVRGLGFMLAFPAGLVLAAGLGIQTGAGIALMLFVWLVAASLT